MIRTVSKIELSFSNPNRWPVGWTKLDCGHAGKLELVCGGWVDNRSLSAHDPKNQITKVGDQVECEACDAYRSKLEKLRALTSTDVSHSRFRTRDSRGIGDGDYYVYAPDAKSPTRCRLLFSIEATKEVADVLDALRASPLSPTEAR